MLCFLTCGVAVTGCAAQSCPLQVEAVLAALAVAALSVSLTVDTVQAPGVPKAVPRSSIAVATHRRCRRRHILFISFIFIVAGPSFLSLFSSSSSFSLSLILWHILFYLCCLSVTCCCCTSASTVAQCWVVIYLNTAEPRHQTSAWTIKQV